MHIGRLLIRVLRWAGLAVLALVVMELCARLDDCLTWGAPFWGPYSNATLVVRDEYGTHNRPNAQFEKWQINSFGFRGPEITKQKPEGVVRVLVIGASESFGLYESPGRDYPAQLDRLLNEREPGRFQVLNAACAGMTLPRFVTYYRTWLAQFDPDIVVVYPTPAGYLETNAPAMEERAGAASAPGLLDSLRLPRRIKTALKRLLPGSWQAWARNRILARKIRDRGPGWSWQQAPLERVQLFREHLEALIGEIRASHAQAVLATHVNRFPEDRSRWTPADRAQLAAWRWFYPRASETAILSMERNCNQVVRDLARSDGLPLVDLAVLMPRTGDDFADFSHFTDQGAQFVASALASEILKLGKKE